ncbi:MAG: hypothetical protein U1F08_05190 [Steroidobacteraceae bacterium]
MSAVGYSGTPLPKKLGIGAGTKLCPIGAPAGYRELLGAMPADTVFQARVSGATDVVHLFCTEAADLEWQLASLRERIAPDATVWVSWPKKASRVPTTITEDVIRAVALPLGYVDVKVCAVSDIWSGLKLVIRKELRPGGRPKARRR